MKYVSYKNMHRQFALLVAVFAGACVVFAFVYITCADFDPNLAANAKNTTWPLAHRRIFEGIVLFWSTASLVGQFCYRIGGRVDESQTVHVQIGGHVKFLELFGGVLLMFTLAMDGFAGGGFKSRHVWTLIAAIAILLTACLHWRWRGATGERMLAE